MADIVISIVAKVAEYLVKPVIREGKYFLCVNKITKDLEDEKEQLTFERESLQDRVEKAKERTEVIEKPVEKWLNDVNNLLEEVAGVEQEMRANRNCFQGWCPTLGRYNLCKKMVKKTEAMGKFKGKSNIHPFSYRARLPGIQYHSTENFTFFETTKVVYDQLFEALTDDCICMIGVYGMGGCGKTTLVIEAAKNVERLNLFDRVILFTVSQTPNIRYIQGKIADMLGLELKEESEEGRAQRIWQSLKDKERVLIIVDDLWGEFNLRNIGICLDNDYRGRWKVIVTTRRQAMCNLMDCQKKIHLGLLSTDESWNLFQKHANIDDTLSLSLNDVPRELCKECNGLPIAIVAIASSLKGESIVEWEVALHNLRHSEAIDDDVEEGMRAAMGCVKLSYDYLRNEETKLLFLMCSMFPEDYDISVEDLIRYAIGLGLGGRFSLESARSRIVASINKLLDSCLLMPVEGLENYVKMHDIVRDVALWIAKTSEDRKILINFDKPVIALVEENSMSDYFAISLWYEDHQFSIELDSPNLEILLLNTSSDNSFNLSRANFEGIEGLKVFHVNKIYFPSSLLSLPQSISCLTNLKTLRLTYWDLDDISFIASLIRLEVLHLKGCSFNELPNEMGKLKRLKLLDLSECEVFQANYNGAIGRCSQLEEFYASNFRTFQFISAIIEDIATLPKLQRFIIYEDYIIRPHNASLIFRSVERRRVLALNDVNISNLEASEKNILQMVDTARLVGLHGGCKNVIPDLVGAVGGMNNLIDLRLVSCAEIDCILDATSHSEVDTSVPRDAQNNLKAPLRHISEERRRVLQLNDVNISNLKASEKNLLQMVDTALLEGLHGGCKNVIPDLVGAVGGMNCLIDLRLLSCAEIDCILDATSHSEVDTLVPRLVELRLSDLENLKEICRGPPVLMSHFFETFEKLYILDCCQLHNLFPRECKLPNLKFLILENGYPKDCKLDVLFSMPVAQSLQQLEMLTIRGCTELKHIIACETEHSSHTSQEIAATPESSHSVMPNLKEVEIDDCQKLECIFPICCVEGLARLQSIQISRDRKLKYVFGECDHKDNASFLQSENQILFPHLEVLLYRGLENFVGICPEKYRAKLLSLGNLVVRS